MRQLASLLAAPAILLGLALLGYWYYHWQVERQESIRGMESAVWRDDWRMVRDTMKNASDVSVSDDGRVLTGSLGGRPVSFYFRDDALWEKAAQSRPFAVLPHAHGAFSLRDWRTVDCRLVLDWPGQAEVSRWETVTLKGG
jgi:hypothetical protein